MTPIFDLGFLGGGQLARMSIQAAQRMGLRCLSLDPAGDSPASQVAPAIEGDLSDPEKIAALFLSCSRIALENEFIPAEAIRQALEIAREDDSRLLPSVSALELIQDKLLQKQQLKRAGVPVPNVFTLGTADADKLFFPLVLKARFGGYDGKGTKTVRNPRELEGCLELLQSGAWIAEELVDFRRELAQMVVRAPDQTLAFPTVVSEQKDHVCDLVYPSDTDASHVAIAAVEAFDGFGLFGVEMFECGDGSILVNEIAPRPHNSGHYTLDWGGISQFEAHVRLALGYPVPAPSGGPVAMANILGQAGAGDHRTAIRAALEESDARVHWYGKSEARPGRKMGHINVPGEGCEERAVRARERFYAAWR